ncbi:MAG: hypothetical protein RJB01_1092 [Actinomycetota bacterium]
MVDGHPTSQRSIVVVSRASTPETEGDSRALLLDLIAGMRGLTAYTVASAIHITSAAAASVINSLLDRVVPVVADAIVSRIDVTELVLSQVDLRPIVLKALDELDLTRIVLDRVDVNAIVAEADIDTIINRVPIVEIADYVMDEIDLPSIIRESTGGVADAAMQGLRMQSTRIDTSLSSLTDRILSRRRARDLDAPGEPDALR